MPSLADGKSDATAHATSREQVLTWARHHGKGEMHGGDGGILVN